ncbi:IclR family transcriptional regulator [Paraburkholderia sp. HP33-1]|uniref:IclR family transcriptional regulator n=1 Tax=Paraburkholderia sp. HP33-1 TaxID=2883243 RepID=UPI001F1D8809|nr:IclR family transcriptional regulator [Paraburkholderia sp. HP33-1]
MLKETSAPADRDVSGPRSLTRLLGIFDVLAKSPDGMSLAELNVALESPKSSLLNLLRPLVAEGYLMHDAGRYRLGPSIFRLSAGVMAAWSFSKTLRPYLVDLSKSTNETVYIGVLDAEHKEITYVDVIESDQSVRYSMHVGRRVPLYCTAAGRVLLAHAPEAFVTDYMKTVKFERHTPRTITTKKALRDELDHILQSGLSVSRGELLPDSAGVSSPIFGPNGNVIAAMAIGAPLERFDRERPQLEANMIRVAQRASALGQAEED